MEASIPGSLGNTPRGASSQLAPLGGHIVTSSTFEKAHQSRAQYLTLMNRVRNENVEIPS